MEDKYIIECRYEYWTLDGKKFNDWFVFNSHCLDKSEALNIIDKVKKDFTYIDKKTKLKHEYRLKNYNDYKCAIDNIRKTFNEYERKQSEYFKSDEYKNLLKLKRQSAKERKIRQQKYINEHTA